MPQNTVFQWVPHSIPLSFFLGGYWYVTCPEAGLKIWPQHLIFFLKVIPPLFVNTLQKKFPLPNQIIQKRRRPLRVTSRREIVISGMVMSKVENASKTQRRRNYQYRLFLKGRKNIACCWVWMYFFKSWWVWNDSLFLLFSLLELSCETFPIAPGIKIYCCWMHLIQLTCRRNHGRIVRAPADRQLHSLNFNEGQLEGCRHTRCLENWRWWLRIYFFGWQLPGDVFGCWLLATVDI